MKQFIQKLTSSISNLFSSKQNNVNTDQTKRQTQKKYEYFSLAKSWADDLYTETIASRYRYKIAFYWASGLASLLIILLMMMLPLEHTELVVVHQYRDGTIWVEPTHQKYAPKNKAQVESDIIRYVTNRESYSPDSYDEQYSLITLLSNSDVAKDYANEQSTHNRKSPINILGTHSYRKVQVKNILFLDNKDFQKDKDKKKQHSNLAQVTFRITDTNKVTDIHHSRTLTTLVSWKYLGTPKRSDDMWRNWDGFSVTRYDIQQNSLD